MVLLLVVGWLFVWLGWVGLGWFGLVWVGWLLWLVGRCGWLLGWLVVCVVFFDT